MPHRNRNNTPYILVIVCGTILALAGMVSALILTLQPGADSNTTVILTFLGFTGTIVAALGFILKHFNDATEQAHNTTEQVSKLESTIRNGGTEEPMKRALASPEGEEAIKAAVLCALQDTYRE